MFKDIVRNSINAMKGDNKIIRLTWFTSFFHSLIVMLLMIVNLNALLARHYENGLYVGKVAQFFIEDIAKNHFIRTTIMITIGLFLLYSIIYPIGQGAIIHYLHDKTKNMRSALRKGRQDFFALFEFSFISLLFAPVVYFFMVFKVLIIDSNTSWQALMRLSILGLVMIAVNGLKTYTRYFIVIRKMPLQEALKESILMAGKRR